MQYEVISDTGILRQRIIKRHGRARQQAIIKRIKQWQALGHIHAGLEPSLLVISIFGLVMFPLIASKSWVGDPSKPKPTPEDIARHAMTVLLHGVGAR